MMSKNKRMMTMKKVINNDTKTSCGGQKTTTNIRSTKQVQQRGEQQILATDKSMNVEAPSMKTPEAVCARQNADAISVVKNQKQEANSSNAGGNVKPSTAQINKDSENGSSKGKY